MSRPDEPQGLVSIYTERAHLVALLARIYPSHGFIPDDAENGYEYAVCLHFPWGQATYHIADQDFMALFAGWLLMTKSDYDGHSTSAKYRAMQEAIRENDVQAFSVGGRIQ